MSPTATPTIQPATFWLTSTAPKMVAMPTTPIVASSRVEARSCKPRRRAGTEVSWGRGCPSGCSDAGVAVRAELSVISHHRERERRHDVPPS